MTISFFTVNELPFQIIAPHNTESLVVIANNYCASHMINQQSSHRSWVTYYLQYVSWHAGKVFLFELWCMKVTSHGKLQHNLNENLTTTAR